MCANIYIHTSVTWLRGKKMEERKRKVEYFKVLGEGLKTRDGKYQWKPGQWNEEPAAVKDGEACGIGLHVFIGKPNWNYTRYIPDHTYRVIAVQGKCGSDLEKARFRRVKLALLPMTLKEILGEKKDGLKGANLSWANLSGAHFCKDMKELSEEQKKQAHC